MNRILNPPLSLRVTLLAAACVFLFGSLSCKFRGMEEEEPEEAPISVLAKKPDVRPIEEVIEVHGNLEPKKQAEVVSEASGAVTKILAEEGDLVEKDQLMAMIDDEEYRLNYNQAKTSYNVARSDYLSTKELYDQGMKSKSEYEKMYRAYKDAKTNLEMNRIRLDNTKVRTPIAGTVVKRNCELYKQVGTMESLFRVADLTGFLIKITITETEVAKISLGQEVRIRVDAVVDDPDDYPFTGKVHKIQPMVDPQTGTVEVEVSFPHPGGAVRPGMFARLKIVTSVHDNAMVIPRRALPADDENHVWVVNGEKARLTEIETGISDENGVEVLTGITPDDLVVVEGHAALTPKSKINIVNGGQAMSEPTTPEPAEP